MTDPTPRLFAPLSVRGVDFPNRLWVAPMCQYAIDEGDGIPRTWHIVHLGAFARGGAGLVMTEATAIDPIGRITSYDTGIWNDAQRDAWAEIVDFIHAQGARAGMQLAHAGAKASTRRPWDGGGRVEPDEGGWTTVSASTDDRLPSEVLSGAEIQHVVDQFVDAARRAAEAGFDVVEVHAAHGYLIHQFLSPAFNRRDDDYGGSTEHRARILVDVIRGIRHALADDYPIFVRLSAVDYIDDGLDAAETNRIARLATEAGADVFDVSSGGLQTRRIPVEPGYQVPFATAVREATGVPVSAVGLITEPDQAERILQDGRADAIMIGREFLRDPHFAARAAAALGIAPPSWPEIYHRARWPILELQGR